MLDIIDIIEDSLVEVELMPAVNLPESGEPGLHDRPAPDRRLPRRGRGATAAVGERPQRTRDPRTDRRDARFVTTRHGGGGGCAGVRIGARWRARLRGVPGARLERARLAAADFKSAVSTIPPSGRGNDSTPGAAFVQLPAPARRSSRWARALRSRAAGTGLCSTIRPLALIRARCTGWLSPETSSAGTLPCAARMAAMASRPSRPAARR